MIEKRNFAGGLNSDDEDRYIPQGDYRNALNCTIAQTDNGANFVVSNTNGNREVFYLLPFGENVVVGILESIKTRSNIYCVYNSLGNHLILQYLWDNDTIVKVLQDDPAKQYLGFGVDFKITGINLINDELLYWTDDNKEPKKINITKAKSGGYPSNFIEHYIYAIKDPPACPPTVAYANDDTRNVNYLNGFLFQFKYRYVYDDYEKSAYSPISTVALPTLSCADFSDELINNAIDVTINTGSEIVSKIEVVARIGNTGDFFSIVILDKADKNFPLASNVDTTYRFFNEKSYLNVNIAESNLLFSNVPRKAKSQDLIDPSRLSYGDVLEGFDPVDVVAELDLEVKDQPNINTYSISGNVVIKNPFVTYQAYQQAQPIYFDRNGDIVFGGVTARVLSNVLHPAHPKRSKLNYIFSDVFNQKLPAGGFTMYLAGTDFAAITKQASPGYAEIIQDSNGIYNFYDNTKKEEAYTEVQQDGNLGKRPVSTFKITGVPPGKYLLRVAGNNTTISDLNSGTRDYQKSSTYTTDVAGSGTTEIEIEITNSDVALSETVIYDLTFPKNNSEALSGKSSMAISGYVTDADVALPSLSNILNDTRIELSKVRFNSNGVDNSFYALDSRVTKAWRGLTPTGGSAGYRHAIADHNGFYFGAFPGTEFVSPGQTKFAEAAYVYSGGVYMQYGATMTAYNTSAATITPSVQFSVGNYIEAILRPNTTGYFNSVRTLLTGTVVNSSGAPVKGISVIVGRGKYEKTLSGGQFSISVYSDSNPLVVGSVRADNIYYSGNGTCFGVFTPSSDFFNISFIQNGGTLGQINPLSPYQGVYDYSDTNVETVDEVVQMFGFTSSEADLKRGGWYQYGVVYYDHGLRSGTTNTNEMPSLTTTATGNVQGLKLYVPFYTEENPATPGVVYGGGQAEVSWSLYNPPPSWATHYQWVRTKNMANNRFIQFAANAIRYTDNFGNTTSYSVGTKMYIDANNINTGYKKVYPTSQLYYDWVKKPTGDRVRFIKDSGGNFFTTYFDTEVIDYVDGEIVIENSTELPDLSGQFGVLYEVYNPKLQLEAEETLFWEIGECYEIKSDSATGNKYHSGPNGDQSVFYSLNSLGQTVSSIPATGIFTGGDTYFRLRNMPVSNSDNTTDYKLRFIEDGSVSDFYQSNVIDIGRPNRYDPDFAEVRRPSTIYYSELYIPETKVNGLGFIYDTSFETYEQKYGSIQKLYYENHNLIVFQELKVGQIPVNLTVMYDNAGQNLVGASAKVLNQIVYYAGEFGIGKNPESFAVYGLSKYFTDRNRYAVLRLDRNGIIPISDYKMHGEFNAFFKDVESVTNQFFYGAYEVNKKKYILSREVSGEVTGKTISFNETTNRWESYYSYLPQFMSGSKSNIISFKDGKLWVHDSSVYNNFYGVQYNREVSAVFNGDPSKKKVFLAISQETEDVCYAQFTTPGGQESNLLVGDFEDIEGFQYAALLFDVNTPNVSDPLNEGDPLRDTTILVKLTNDKTTYSKMFAINMLYENSERSNK